jgi:tetrahydromethanopterin S-methyltransferase subunit G
VVILGLIIGLFTYSFLGQVSASKDRDNQISGRVDKLETKIDNLQASVSQIGADVSGIRGALKIK